MDLAALVTTIAAEMAVQPERGRVADYIPGLACVDPAAFGIAVVLADGTTHVAGDADVAFSIQSISKVFVLALALGRVGDALWRRVGREPSGSAFNSIIQLELEKGIPRNPFINAGALVASDVVLAGHRPSAAVAQILGFVRQLAGDDQVFVDDAIARGEATTGFRNAALANYIRSYGNLDHPVDQVLDVYFHQCALAMSCRQVAMAGRFLMLDGALPSGASIVAPVRARRINSLMMLCGHYDGSGEFAFRVGMPGKSGVGGGILAVAPGIASVAVWSPGLNARGNSLIGSLALERLAGVMNWSVFTRSC